MDTFINFLLTELRKVHTRTYYRMAPAGTQMPYAVFTFPPGTQDEHREDFSLEINIWGTTKELKDVDKLPKVFKDALNRMQANEAGFTTRLSYLNTLRVPDPDINIERREVRFICQTYWK